MSRIETIGAATLYLGDYREIELPKADALVTDPPYGIGERMQGGTWGAADKYADFRAWDVAPSDEDLTRLRSLAPSSIIWGGNYFEARKTRCWLIWDKQNAVRTMADFEMAWTNLDRPAKRFSWPVGTHAWGHPTEKPLELMCWCIDQLPTSAVTILDPFMGSGTTGVAATKRGRRFIGVEAVPKYFDIACRRVAEAVATPDMFVERPAPAVQASLLDYDRDKDVEGSFADAYAAVRERVAKGGPGWEPK